MTVMSKRREKVFENLGKDISNLEDEDIKNGIAPEHPDQISAAEKTQFALRRTQKETEAYESLFEDICRSLTEVSGASIVNLFPLHFGFNVPPVHSTYNP